MPNPANQTNTTIPEEIYNILKEIKEKKQCTFDEILNQLCELDFQYNYIEKTQDYDLYYNDNIFSFRIVFKKEDLLFIYKTPTGDESYSISEWGLPDSVRKTFYTFIKEDYARSLLENMPLGLVFKDFDIYKVP